MASANKSRAESVALGVLTAVLIALLLGGWASKESTAAHAADVAKIRADGTSVRDSLYFKLERIKDIVCEDKPRSRLCK